jgi:multidrug efflux pump subunit AcrB
VRDVQIYAGTAAPFNFNGLVRHAFLRRDPFRADLQVNLVAKQDRASQSHEYAMAIRPALQAIGRARHARVSIVEVPPGTPVLDTLVAEIYGPTAADREALARQVRGLFESEPDVVDVSDSLEAVRTRTRLAVDGEKAGLHGASVAQGATSAALRLAVRASRCRCACVSPRPIAPAWPAGSRCESRRPAATWHSASWCGRPSRLSRSRSCTRT